MRHVTPRTPAGDWAWLMERCADLRREARAAQRMPRADFEFSREQAICAARRILKALPIVRSRGRDFYGAEGSHAYAVRATEEQLAKRRALHGRRRAG